MSVDTFPAKPSTPSSGRNRNLFLSKFRSQLGHRNRSITDFYIEPDDPWRTYSPGDSIHGTVVLTAVRPVSITHIVLCLHGFVKVYRNAVAPGEAAPDTGFLGPGRGRRGSEYLGNGLATLFEDEIILCGDGRLKEGIYKFRFEMLFPPYALPTSITFERGTISYMLTATLTKPTTISPMLSCRKRVNVLENIDIAPFPVPKPRVVTLEPVSKRSKSRTKGKSTYNDPASDNISLSTSTDGTRTSGDHCPPLSPATSDFSSSSQRSNSTQSVQIISNPSSSVRNVDARSVAHSNSDKNKLITATAEVLRSGVLPGDTVPLKISVNHFKQIRSPNGIIVTLYRQGRIDLHPAIPIGPTAANKKPLYEDCYPRSRTGLSGLTLGSSRTNSVFRKDLSQTFAPVIIDPTTMSADVKTSIRLPEDTFPTITRVPGDMVSFRYYIEVVVDLRGKLTAPDRLRPRLNMVSSGKSFSSSGQVLNSADPGGSSITANWAGNILDTGQIRREKGVIALVFEVVVGTRDSARRFHQDSTASAVDASAASQTTHSERPSVSSAREHEGYFDDNAANAGYSDEDDISNAQGWDWTEPPDEGWEPPGHAFEQIIPPPQPEEPVDEKTRLRRAEEMLLPSQPPGEDDAGPSTVADDMNAPTAPVLPEDDNAYDYQHVPEETVPTVSYGGYAGPFMPSEHLAGPAGFDKQELERQRLMAETSAPDMGSVDGDMNHDGGADAPSAPVFDEEEEIIGIAHGGESLPRYQR